MRSAPRRFQTHRFLNEKQRFETGREASIRIHFGADYVSMLFLYVLLVTKAIWQYWHANIPEQRRKFILWQGRAQYRVCAHLCVCVFCSRIEETHFQNGAG